ncbi:transposase, partial [Limnohabitans sp.]|uniref:transposase n=1 Tax=Limnohabitans sp. TaxID=1907725 RepID=UPI0038621600
INENTNGFLRQYFPKGSDLSVHSQEHLDAVAWRLNTRPKKSLDWKSILNLSQPSVALLP